MRRISLEECYRLLDLPASATTEQIRAAFRRLAKEHHPDVHSRRRDHRRFVEVANAYRILREKLRVRPPDSEWGPCPRCGQFSDILVGLDGRKSCPDCLLGVTQRSRILPMPFIPLAKHLVTLMLYGASVYFLFVYLESGAMRHAAISLGCVATGLLVLAAEVLWLIRDDEKVRKMRLNDPRRTRRHPVGRRLTPFPASASRTLPGAAVDGQRNPSENHYQGK
jgi:hypothetical protein